MLFALPATVLFGWIAGSVAHRPAATWAAVAVPTVLVPTLLLAPSAVKPRTGARDDGDLPAPSFVAVITARLLIRSAGQLGAADAGARTERRKLLGTNGSGASHRLTRRGARAHDLPDCSLGSARGPP